MKYLLFLLALPLFAQPQAHIYVVNAPSGACPARAVPQIRLSTGAIYTCAAGTWSVTGTVSPTGTVTSVALTRTNDTNINATITGSPITTNGTFNIAFSWAGILSIARGGTGTATPGLVAGTNITITGTWPNQTINSSGGGSGGNCNTGTANQVFVSDGAGNCTPSSVTIDPTAGLAGGISMPQGTAKVPSANNVIHQAPTSVTAYSRVLQSSVGLTGIVHETVSGSTQTESVSAVSMTTDIIGITPLANGGTNGSDAADNGGIVYSNASGYKILAHTATAGLALLSGNSTLPSWSAAAPVLVTRNINTTSPLAGGGDLSADRTLTCTTCTITIASGTSALGTSTIASGACATVVTTSATGTASTDAIIWNPNASIKAVTGYTPATTGGLSIAGYPTTNNVNFDVCNWSNASITPGAVTLNWRVVR